VPLSVAPLAKLQSVGLRVLFNPRMPAGPDAAAGDAAPLRLAVRRSRSCIAAGPRRQVNRKHETLSRGAEKAF